MSDRLWRMDGSPPQLLVSVRNSKEAADALAGGADIIDVKEPARGSLGVADRNRIEEVLDHVAGRRVVSMAAGELLEARSAKWGIPDGVGYVKFGLSQCAAESQWAVIFGELRRTVPANAQVIPVIYADWRAAQSPPPDIVFELVSQLDCPVVLVDTFNKRGGGLFDHWSFARVQEFVHYSHSIGTSVAVAGGLRIDDLERAADTGADVIGVRGAVCVGSRSGELQCQLVNQSRLALKRSGATILPRKKLSFPSNT